MSRALEDKEVGFYPFTITNQLNVLQLLGHPTSMMVRIFMTHTVPSIDRIYLVHAIVFIVSMSDFDQSDPHEPQVNRFVSKEMLLTGPQSDTSLGGLYYSMEKCLSE